MVSFVVFELPKSLTVVAKSDVSFSVNEVGVVDESVSGGSETGERAMSDASKSAEENELTVVVVFVEVTSTMDLE